MRMTEPPLFPHVPLVQQARAHTPAEIHTQLLVDSSFALSDSPGPSVQDTALDEQLLGVLLNLHNEFNFAAIPLDGTGLSVHTFDTGWTGGVQSEPIAPSKSFSTSFSEAPPEPKESEPLPEDERSPGESSLEKTKMFLVVLIFLQDVGELLYILSGRSLASRRHQMYTAEQAHQERFYWSAQETFFAPCYQGIHSTFPTATALLSVAETFTRNGCLRSVAEIKHYLGSVATVRTERNSM